LQCPQAGDRANRVWIIANVRWPSSFRRAPPPNLSEIAKLIDKRSAKFWASMLPAMGFNDATASQLGFQEVF
jgi:hypothetical protein